MRNTRPMHAARDDYDEPFFCERHETWHKDDVCPECYDRYIEARSIRRIRKLQRQAVAV